MATTTTLKPCIVCHAKPGTHVCSTCQNTKNPYCGRACQVVDWKRRHKFECVKSNMKTNIASRYEFIGIQGAPGFVGLESMQDGTKIILTPEQAQEMYSVQQWSEAQDVESDYMVVDYSGDVLREFSKQLISDLPNLEDNYEPQMFFSVFWLMLYLGFARGYRKYALWYTEMLYVAKVSQDEWDRFHYAPLQLYLPNLLLLEGARFHDIQDPANKRLLLHNYLKGTVPDTKAFSERRMNLIILSEAILSLWGKRYGGVSVFVKQPFSESFDFFLDWNAFMESNDVDLKEKFWEKRLIPHYQETSMILVDNVWTTEDMSREKAGQFFWMMAEYGFTDVVKGMQNLKPFTGDFLNSAVKAAIRNDHLDAVKLLVNKDQNAEAASKLLWFTIFQDKMNVFQYFLSLPNTDPSVFDNQSLTTAIVDSNEPNYAAMLVNDRRFYRTEMRRLLKSEDLFNQREEGTTKILFEKGILTPSSELLYKASETGNAEMTIYLLSRIQDKEVNSELIEHAVRHAFDPYNGLRTLDALLRDGRADPNDFAWKNRQNDPIPWDDDDVWYEYGFHAPLVIAANEGRVEAVARLLADSRVDPAIEDSLALERAIVGTQSAAIVNMLLDTERMDVSARNYIYIQLAFVNGLQAEGERMLSMQSATKRKKIMQMIRSKLYRLQI